ncbi:MAG: NAD(P)/FAD-dependent oxidoreductase [Candidatus Korobacteraceae bacterium]
MPGHASETEVFVVGAGPAGLAAALAVKRAGYDVVVADCSQPPIDKACGEGIMPDGLQALQQLGVRLDESQAACFEGIRFINGSQQVEARFSHGSGLGVRRTVLHQQLGDAASQAGVRLLWNRRFTGMTNGFIRLEEEAFRCRWIVGADGQNSRVRHSAGLQCAGKERVRFGMRQHYRVRPWSDFVEVHWSDYGEMYVTPIADDAVCVALISSRKPLRFEEALRHFPVLASNLKDGMIEGHPRGAVTASRRLNRVYRNSVALIGEAAGSVDAITGEGLAIAFRQATALASALAANDLSIYDAACRQIMRLPRAMTSLMLSLDSRPAFRRRAFGALEAKPAVFERMLAIHTGSASLTQVGLGNTLSFGWHLLTDVGATR